MSDTFTCSMCGNTYDKGWTDEEAAAEKNELWGSVPLDDCDVVCEDCFQKIMPQNGVGPTEPVWWPV